MYTITTKQPPALTILHTYCTGGTKRFTATTQYIILLHRPTIDGEFLVRGCVKTAIFFFLLREPKLALVPGLPHFDLTFVFTTIHGTEDR